MSRIIKTFEMPFDGGDKTAHFQIFDGAVNQHTIEVLDNDFNEVELTNSEYDEIAKDCQQYYNDMMYVKRQYLAEKANGYLDKTDF